MTETKTSPIVTPNLRANLKTLLVKEMNNLPEYFETLSTKDRLDYPIKLMPYVFQSSKPSATITASLKIRRLINL